MKTLVVYDAEGNIIFTQSNANSNYYTKTQEVDDNKIVIGIDLENDMFVTVDSFLPISERNKKITELTEKNKEYLLKHELEESKRANNDLNKEIRAEIDRLKSANAEIIEYVNILTGLTEDE